MQEDYYINTLYPLQDIILNIIGKFPVGFYLTGGTALSRAFLNHRFSDDLDFFVNNAADFKSQVNTVVMGLKDAGMKTEILVANEGFARLLVLEGECSLKLDFVNDVPYRHGNHCYTALFTRTDNLTNILSNKITALGRYSSKDVVDIVFICRVLEFNWEKILMDASEKDLWVNPLSVVDVLEQFPIEKLNEISWTNNPPENGWFQSQIDRIIPEILEGSNNSLFELF